MNQAAPTIMCTSCYRTLTQSFFSVTRDPRLKYCKECQRADARLSRRRNAGGYIDPNPKKTKYPLTIFNLNTQNRQVLALGFLRATAEFPAYDVVTKEPYTF